MVVGNISSGALPTSVSPSAAIFQREPYGVPCASETYQNLPSGETVTLWGPSMSAGMMPTGTTLTVRSAAPSQASWVTMSPDSLVTRMRKSGPCWPAARPPASAASARIEERSFTGAAKDRASPGGLKPPRGRQSWQRQCQAGAPLRLSAGRRAARKTRLATDRLHRHDQCGRRPAAPQVAQRGLAGNHHDGLPRGRLIESFEREEGRRVDIARQ